MLYDVLAGGASRSLRIDTQGKTLALALLRMPLALLEDSAAHDPPARGASRGSSVLTNPPHASGSEYSTPCRMEEHHERNWSSTKSVPPPRC